MKLARLPDSTVIGGMVWGSILVVIERVLSRKPAIGKPSRSASAALDQLLTPSRSGDSAATAWIFGLYSWRTALEQRRDERGLAE